METERSEQVGSQLSVTKEIVPTSPHGLPVGVLGVSQGSPDHSENLCIMQHVCLRVSLSEERTLAMRLGQNPERIRISMEKLEKEEMLLPAVK